LRDGEFVDCAAPKKEQDNASASDGGVGGLAGFPVGLRRSPGGVAPPTVTYSYSAEADYDDIEARADLYCEEQYDADAVLVDRDPEGDGYKAVFACR
jgi:hypothetical protein